MFTMRLLFDCQVAFSRPTVLFPSKNKNPVFRTGFFVYGGGAGIRTPDTADMSRML